MWKNIAMWRSAITFNMSTFIYKNSIERATTCLISYESIIFWMNLWHCGQKYNNEYAICTVVIFLMSYIWRSTIKFNMSTFSYKNPYLELGCLFCFVCYVQISQTMHPPVALFLLSEWPQRGGVHKLGFMVFWFTMKKLWICELFLVLKN